MTQYTPLTLAMIDYVKEYRWNKKPIQPLDKREEIVSDTLRMCEDIKNLISKGEANGINPDAMFTDAVISSLVQCGDVNAADQFIRSYDTLKPGYSSIEDFE